MSFATRLKTAMEEMEVSQCELATQIGKGKSSVSQYLSGKNVPRVDIQQRIADALDCTVEFLNSEESAEDISTTGLRRVSVAQAAKLLDKSEQFVRISLQAGTAPFGFASRRLTTWSYHISPKKLNEYIGL